MTTAILCLALAPVALGHPIQDRGHEFVPRLSHVLIAALVSMTSDGGVDGPASMTGFFSLDAGTTWAPEGDGWHHAFEIATSVPDQCSNTDPTTCGKLGGSFQGIGTDCASDPCGP